MALNGTIKDFGIADILQLIGQQQKTGVLYLENKNEQAEVSFVNGNVARAQNRTRKSHERLGAMLVGCGLLTEAELTEALETQKRTLKRLGDILVADGKVSAAELREMTLLQTQETIYSLFTWKSGTYEFVQQDVEHDPGQSAELRPESLLMEGFRRIDEWPMVRERVPSLRMTFERAKPLGAPRLEKSATVDDVDRALDAAIQGAEEHEPLPRSIGRNEQLVYSLADPAMTAARLCDLSRLGEFETCKALYNLIEAGYLTGVAPTRKARREGASAGGRSDPLPRFDLRRKFKDGAFQTVVGLFIVVLFALGARAFGEAPEVTLAREGVRAQTGATERVLARSQIAKLQNALELYRLDTGAYPPSLEALVQRHPLRADELRRPFTERYHYRPDGASYILLSPLR